ncbi:hypothetical protein [Pseudoxanthomonas putridarboris]|uniref:Uncharacterized protein n=1 Tax=Pseudoxanthomonas putridarboris TaxID=752605 RepID=A0ABU9J3G8_9GAMM
MLLARLFRSLDRPTETPESKDSGALLVSNRLNGQGFRGPSPSRRQQLGGAPGRTGSAGTLGMYSGIIPRTGVFIP